MVRLFVAVLSLAVAVTAGCIEPQVDSKWYDDSCSNDRDCVLVETGPRCDWCCGYDALNTEGAKKYERDRANLPCVNPRPNSRYCECGPTRAYCDVGKCSTQ